MPIVAGLAAVDEVVIASALLLLGAALWPLFRPLLGGGMSRFPVIGPWIGARVDSLLWLIWNAAVDSVNAGIGPMVDAITRLWADVYFLGWRTITAAEYLGWSVIHLFTNWIPYAIDYANKHADVLYHWSIAHADQVGRDVAAQALQWVNYAIGHGDILYGWAVAHADQVGQAVAAQALQWVNYAVGHADVLYHWATAYAEQLTAGAVQRGDGQYLDVLRRLQGAEQGLTDLINQGIRAAEDHADGVGVISRGYADGVGDRAEAYARAQAMPIAKAVSAIEALPCLQHCAELGSLGSDLAGLNLAEILLLLIEASRDPGRGRERILGQVLEPAQRITDDVKRLVGAL